MALLEEPVSDRTGRLVRAHNASIVITTSELALRCNVLIPELFLWTRLKGYLLPGKPWANVENSRLKTLSG
jgi:hypothetical protein